MRLVSLQSFPKATWPMCLAFLIGAVQQGTCSLAEAKEVPLRGTIQAVESYDAQFPTLFVDGSGFGKATRLGRYTITYAFVVDLPTLAGNGTAQFIAANGDYLNIEVTGQAYPTENPEIAHIEETYTIVGGSGRFAGATGEFAMERVLNTVTGVTSGSFHGTIIKSAATHH